MSNNTSITSSQQTPPSAVVQGNGVVQDWSNNNMFSEELKAAINDIVPVTDKDFDRHDFDPIKYINEHFPTEQSLSGLNNFMNRLRGKIEKIDHDIIHTVRLQSTSGNKGKEDLENAKKSIVHLMTKIRDIKCKAIQSEQIVTEICKDIKTLDYAKKNLTTSITTLKRLHMMVLGVAQLKDMVDQRQYETVAKLLEATAQISQGFKDNSNSPKIRQLNEELERIRIRVKDLIYDDFKKFGSVDDMGGQSGERWKNTCYAIDALGPEVKKDFLRWFCGQQLNSYTSAFSNDSEHHGLESTDRRFAWLARQLQSFRQSYEGVFPAEWYIEEQIAYEFCILTRLAISDILRISNKSDIDVKVLVKALKSTLKFESRLYKTFESQNAQYLNEKAFSMTPNSFSANNSPPGATPGSESDEDDNDDHLDEDGEVDNSEEGIRRRFLMREEKARKKEHENAVASGSTSPVIQVEPRSYERFKGILSSCFDPYLHLYTEQEGRLIQQKIEQFLSSEPWQIEDEFAQNKVLGSSADMISLFIDTMRHCNNLSNGEPYYDIYLIFRKNLIFYAQRLAIRAANTIASGSSSSTSAADQLAEDKTLCLIVNTGEYCRKNVGKLEDSFRNSISDRFKDKINLFDVQNEFNSGISKAASSLVASLEMKLEPHFLSMTKMDWVNIREEYGVDGELSDNSPYATEMANMITETCKFVANWIPDHYGYYCDLLVASLPLKFVQNIYKCKGISEKGSNGIQLDISFIKATLAAQKKGERFKILVNKNFNEAENILKIITVPLYNPRWQTDPTGQSKEAKYIIHEAYNSLFPNSSESDFNKLLDLKGAKSSEKSDIIFEWKKYKEKSAKEKSDSTATPNQSNSNTTSSSTPNFMKKFNIFNN